MRGLELLLLRARAGSASRALGLRVASLNSKTVGGCTGLGLSFGRPLSTASVRQCGRSSTERSVQFSQTLIRYQGTTISQYTANVTRCRLFCTSRALREVQPPVAKAGEEPASSPAVAEDNGAERGFARTEKASQAAQVNLSARLSKEGASQSQSAGFWEVWRLLKIARPEAKILGGKINLSGV